MANDNRAQRTGPTWDERLDAEREVFTVEPSLTQDGVWHIGVFPSGKEIAVARAQMMGY